MQEFRLLRYIKFNCKLMQLQQSARSQWQVMYTNTAVGAVHTATLLGVMMHWSLCVSRDLPGNVLQEKRNFKIMASFVVICTGLHTTPHVPSYQVGHNIASKAKGCCKSCIAQIIRCI